jgi:class 3 adenylate cyclase
MDEHDLLESQIQAINRFPDQNPNPVLRMAADGYLTYANRSSEPVRLALGISVGERVPLATADQIRALATGTLDRLEVEHDHRTYALLAVDVPEMGFVNIYGSDVTGEKVVERFPHQNPNPVFRVDDDGRLIYANDASQPLIEAVGMSVGQLWPADFARLVLASADGQSHGPLELDAGSRTYALKPVRVSEFGFINVYGTDITAEKVVAKFPGQNPNPVLRLTRTGELIYANDASQPIVRALALSVGAPVPAELAATVFERLAADSRVPIEVVADEQTFEIVPVLVDEFDFINLYGTDVTAARALAEAKDQTERLLLNILPPPIAERLRSGERVIADRFEDATLLIADIVGFTQMSDGLSPNELVELLDDVFSVCDVLVERHGLEKVKTIGDAYMVVGGVPTVSSDHAARVADFALDMAAAVEAFKEGHGDRVSFRIGINSGPVVAGVIGSKRTIYDVWGDTVNVASRMESLGLPGRIQVSAPIYERLRDRYMFEPRGPIEVKGKGTLPTWFLLGRR